MITDTFLRGYLPLLRVKYLITSMRAMSYFIILCPHVHSHCAVQTGYNMEGNLLNTLSDEATMGMFGYQTFIVLFYKHRSHSLQEQCRYTTEYFCRKFVNIICLYHSKVRQELFLSKVTLFYLFWILKHNNTVNETD